MKKEHEIDGLSKLTIQHFGGKGPFYRDNTEKRIIIVIF